MVDETKPPRGTVGRRFQMDRPAPVPLTEEQLASRALATQGHPQTLVESLTADQQAALAAALGADGLAVPDELDDAGEILRPGTARIVKDVLDDYYAEHKAVVDELPAGGTPFEATS